MLKAFDVGIECVGIKKGWKGFLENNTMPLNIAEHDDLHTIGGTILYTSRTNPYKGIDKNNPEEVAEVTKKMAKKFDELDIDALIVIGGVLK